MEHDFTTVVRRDDGSYVVDGGMYHVPNSGEWATLWAEVDAYVKEHPDCIVPEKPFVMPDDPPVVDATQERLDDIENALVELAAIIGGE